MSIDKQIKILVFMCLLFIGSSLMGCNAGKRTPINQARLSNNKDDVKVSGLQKIITAEGRDYYVIYAYFKNNTDKELNNIHFNFELNNKSGESVLADSFNVDLIKPGKTVKGSYHVIITEDTDIENVKSIIFTSFSHTKTKGNIKCSKEIKFNMDSIRKQKFQDE